MDELLMIPTECLRFELAVLEAVDKGLLVLGESAKHAVYYHVEMGYQVKREDIPRKIEAFHGALEGLLGAGAAVIERLIAKNLHGKIGLDFEEREGWTLVDYVRHAKRAEKRGNSARR